MAPILGVCTYGVSRGLRSVVFIQNNYADRFNNFLNLLLLHTCIVSTVCALILLVLAILVCQWFHVLNSWLLGIHIGI